MTTLDNGVSECVISDWDDAYANAAYIPDAEHWLTAWPRRAATFSTEVVDGGHVQRNRSYGSHPREVMNVFHPAGAPCGVAVIVHGGYWLKFDAHTFAHLARGARDRGWVVVMPCYPLCPNVHVSGITASIGRAVTEAAGLAGGPLRLAGHSAGGHLVTRQVCRDTCLDRSVYSRIDRVLSISGVHDLMPLRNTRMNDSLAIDEHEALRESPSRLAPLDDASVIAWVGGDERPEFLRQTALLETAWTSARVHTHVEPGRHHFNVIEDLERADSTLMDRWLGH